MEEELCEVHLRLMRVVVENMDWASFVQQYDRPATFFYLDPPYLDLPFYKHNFEPADFDKMAGLLRGIKGKFLMSLNDRPEIRKIFSGFNIDTVKVPYSVSPKKRLTGVELLIRNY